MPFVASSCPGRWFLVSLLSMLATAACSSSESGDASTSGAAGSGGPSGVGGASGGSSSEGGGGANDGGRGGESASVGGGGGAGGSGGAATCAGPAWPDNAACEACQNAKCCINASNCSADAECTAIMECAVDGGTGCTAGHQDGIWYYSGLAICLQNQCASECGVAPAECGAIQPTPASCTDEVYETCCAETEACGQSDACVAFIYQCIDQNDCAEPGCFNDCLAMYPDAEDPFMTMANCWADVPCL